MFEIFALGTLWFWLLSVAAFITITAFVEYGFPGRATSTLIAFFVLVQFLGGWQLLQWITYNPGQACAFAVLYFVVGSIYCIIKWYFFLLNKRDELREQQSKPKTSWNYSNKLEEPPKPKDHRSDLIGWIMYWPFSAIWTLINDPVKRIAQTIYLQIESVLQKISDGVFKNETFTTKGK